MLQAAQHLTVRPGNKQFFGSKCQEGQRQKPCSRTREPPVFSPPWTLKELQWLKSTSGASNLPHILCELQRLLLHRGSDVALDGPRGISTKHFITHIKQASSCNWRKINCSFHTRAVRHANRTQLRVKSSNTGDGPVPGAGKGILMSRRWPH